MLNSKSVIQIMDMAWPSLASKTFLSWLAFEVNNAISIMLWVRSFLFLYKLNAVKASSSEPPRICNKKKRKNYWNSQRFNKALHKQRTLLIIPVLFLIVGPEKFSSSGRNSVGDLPELELSRAPSVMPLAFSVDWVPLGLLTASKLFRLFVMRIKGCSETHILKPGASTENKLK